MKTFLAAAASAFALAVVSAQEPYRATTDLVVLSVSVTDPDGKLVPGLAKEDFQIFEDGVAQELFTFSREPQPIALSMLLDTSMSMDKRLPIAQEGAIGFARRLGPSDVAQVIDFDSRPTVLQTFTNDRALLEKAIKSTTVGGSTSLYNALYIAMTSLRELRATQSAGDIHRQAIVVLSDGEDTSSVIGQDMVMDLAKRADVIIFPIVLRTRVERPVRQPYNESEHVLRSLALETGGRIIFIDDAAQLPTVYQQLADELANQYTMSYASKNSKRDGAWRTIAVRLTRPGTAARTKSGYFGPTVHR